MKRTFLLICTILCANVLLAQEQLAVLKHNDSIRVYYGSDAFKQAYNAAVNGDVITLSDGIFSAPNEVQKGITVRGNGAVADTARKSIGTYFMESFRVSGLGDSLQFSAEGIYFDYLSLGSTYDVNLTRCYIDYFSSYGGVQATNCIIKKSLYGTSSNNNTYINCVLVSLNGSNPSNIPYYVICNNCIILGASDDIVVSGCRQYQFNNCIVMKKGPYSDAILNGSLNNSILIGFTGTDNPTSSGNVAMSISDVFENWNGNTITTDLEAYVLKSSVSDSIQGLDGTEVGIFGGFMPFDWRPSYSIIKRFNVANRTTADGKLSVDIEVVTE